MGRTSIGKKEIVAIDRYSHNRILMMRHRFVIKQCAII